MKKNKIIFEGFKIKIETDEQNISVQEKIKELNKGVDRFAWNIYIDNGTYAYFNLQKERGYEDVSTLWKGFRYLCINEDLDLFLFPNEKTWERRTEPEISVKDLSEVRVNIESIFVIEGINK